MSVTEKTPWGVWNGGRVERWLERHVGAPMEAAFEWFPVLLGWVALLGLLYVVVHFVVRYW